MCPSLNVVHRVRSGISVCVCFFFYFFGNVSEVVLECMRRTLAKEKSELQYMLLCMTQRERMKLPQTDLKIKHMLLMSGFLGICDCG